MCSKKPYICYYKDTKNYCAYIPYHSNNQNDFDEFRNTFRACLYFNLPTTREDGEVSYSYEYGNNIFELGIMSNDLQVIRNKMQIIQIAIQRKGCSVYEGDEEIEVEEYD